MKPGDGVWIESAADRAPLLVIMVSEFRFTQSLHGKSPMTLLLDLPSVKVTGADGELLASVRLTDEASRELATAVASVRIPPAPSEAEEPTSK